MTPAEVEAVFYETYRKGLWEKPGERLVQSNLREKCWQAVIDHVRKEVDKEWCLRLMEQSSSDCGPRNTASEGFFTQDYPGG